MNLTMFPNNEILAHEPRVRLFFKGEDFDDDGAPTGPLYALTDKGKEIRSTRYVRWAEAKQIARYFNAELQEI